MNDIKDYEDIKKRILSAYESLKTSGLIPLKVFNAEIDEAAIDETALNLVNDRFITSVCGQIKAGKSMFLNDLIFGSPVLPVADTPETAKITEITHAEKSSFTVYFYSRRQWEFITDSTIVINDKNESYYDVFLKPALDNIKRLYGEELNIDEFFDRKEYIETDLSLLRDYITVNGRYTPLVKNIRIGYPSDFLKNMHIVDTPGINDPDAVRSRISEKWISRSDAVIYLLSAAQPFTKEDREFFERYLSGIPDSKILITVSKIDLAEDPKKAIEYASDSIKKTLGNKIKTAADSLYSIAPMFPLYKKIKSAAIEKKITLCGEISETIRYHLEERTAADPNIKNIADCDGYMPEFKKAIEEKLKASKTAIINSHNKKIESIFDCGIQNAINEIKIKTERTDAMTLEISRLQSELIKQKDEINKIISFKEALTSELNELSSFFNRQTQDIFSRAASIIIKKINDSKLLNEIRANIAFDCYNAIETGFNETCSKFEFLISEFKDKAPSLAGDLFQTEFFSRNPSGIEAVILYKNTINQSFNKIDSANVSLCFKNFIFSAMKTEELNKTIVKKLFFWLDCNKTKENIKLLAKRVLLNETELKRIITEAGTNAAGSIKTAFGRFIFRLDERCAELKKLCYNIETAINKVESDIKKLTEDLTKNKQSIKAIELRRDETLAMLK